VKEVYNNKFSIGHWDAMPEDDLFLECFENSSDQYKKEIYDIYFGGTFMHRDVMYGDVMGHNPSDAQYKNLLKIQEKYNIPISLTLNEMNRPLEILRPDILKELIAYIKKFYDDGIRSCTISHTHLMKTGALQDSFPHMNWKNTVNHRIRTTQEFHDYVSLGYNTIQLDRNFNRSLDELKKVCSEAEKLGVTTTLLIKENCMPECPFKTEHDCWQSGKTLRDLKTNYWEAIPFTCNEWRNLSMHHGTNDEIDKYVHNPRTGTDVVMITKDDWKEFANLVDVFKLSGRLITSDGKIIKNMAHFLERHRSNYRAYPKNANVVGATDLYEVDSFKDVYENNLTPLHMWLSFCTVYDTNEYKPIRDIKKIKEEISDHFWNSKKAVTLKNILKNCNNQCYACHACDDVFGTDRMDSIIDVKGRVKNLPPRMQY